MKIMHWILAGVTVISPLVGRAQSASLAKQETDSAPPVLDLVKGNRAGISIERLKGYQSSITPAEIDTLSRVSRGRLVESGAILGIISGAGVGAAVGLVIDSRAERDTMIGVTPFLAAFGAAIGLITGLLVGVFIPEQ